MVSLLIIAVGGGLGAVTRYLVSNWAAARYGVSFPYGTLIVNVVGCLIIGVFMGLITDRIVVNPYWRLLITTGFLGGLTTFSSFGYETISLTADGTLQLALFNILLNVFLGLAASWFGLMLAKLI